MIRKGGPPLTLSQNAYQELRELIASRKLPPGTKLNPAQLASDLQVSTTIIREALLLLRGDGLIDYRNRRGAYVMGISGEDIEQVYSLRAVLDSMAAAQAAPRMQADDIRFLHNLIERQATQTDSSEEFRRMDEAFHDFIVDRSGNKWLTHALRGFNQLLWVIRKRVSRIEADKALAEHREIVAALARRDAPAAGRLMASHFTRVKEDALAALGEQNPPGGRASRVPR